MRRAGRHRGRRAAVASAAIAILLLALAPAALAGKTVVKTLGTTTSGTTGGLFNQPRGIAVNKTGNGGVPAGTFYVADSSNLRIQRFSPTGDFVSAWGWDVNSPDNEGGLETCTVASECITGDPGSHPGQLAAQAQGLAVNQSNGILFVADQGNRRIDAFSATGAFEGAFGWGVVDGSPALQFCTTTCVAGLAGGAGGQFGGAIGGLAVDGSQTIYVADKTNRRIDVFTPTIAAGQITGASFARAFGWDVASVGDPGDTVANEFEVCTTVCKQGASGTGLGQFGTNSPVDVALDSSGNVYALDAPNKRLEKFDLSSPTSPAPVGTPAFDPSAAIVNAFGAVPGNLYGLGFDTTTNHIYLSGSSSTTSPSNLVRIVEIDASGARVDLHGTDLSVTTSTGGLAVTPAAAGGNIYLASSNGGQRVFVLNKRPIVELNEVTQRTRSTATFTATVNPLGNSVACKFQYSLDGISWTDLPDPDCASLASEGRQPISEQATGLTAETAYHVRLVVTTAGGGIVTTPEKLFSTRGRPVISATAAAKVTETGVTLSAQIAPEAQATTYHFEYVDDAEYQANGFADATQAPSPEASAGSGGDAVPVSVTISDLAPGTLYRFRLLASNESGTREGPERSFTTFVVAAPFEPCGNDVLRTEQPSGALPDCRAYEQVSPVDKNGGDVTGVAPITKASVSGDKVVFQATSPIPGGEGSQSFDPIYLASRGPEGWSTQGLMPPATEGEEAGFTNWTPEFSHVFSWVRRFGTPNTTAVLDRSTVDHSVTAVLPHDARAARPVVAGSSDDGSIVFFENGSEGGAALTENAAAQKPNLYVWDRESGVVKLAGVLNDGKAPSAGAFAGPYGWVDGGTALGGVASRYYVRDIHAIAPDGSSVYFTAAETGQLYLRLNPTKPQSPLDDEGECTDPALACTIHVSASQKHNGMGLEGNDGAGPHPAALMGAAADGSKAFFTSSEMLTNKANTGPEQSPAQIGRAKLGASEAEEAKPSFLPKRAVGVTVSPDGEYLYWADPVDGTIGRAKLDGDDQPSESEVDDKFIVPGPTEFVTHPRKQPGVVTVAPSTPRYVAVDGEYVYWTNTGPLADYGVGDKPVDGGGTIGRAKLGVSGPEEVDPAFIAGASNPQGIVVDSGHIYWANGEGGGFGENLIGPHKWISRADLEGNNVELEAFRATTSDTPFALAIDSTNLYYVMYEPGNGYSYVGRVPLEHLVQGEQQTFGIGKTRTDGIALDGPNLYWTAKDEGTIGRRPIASFSGSCSSDPNCKEEYLKLEGSLDGLATDGTHLYWATNGEAPSNPGNDLYSYDVAKGKLTDLTVDAADANGAEVQGVVGASEDGSYIYFVANAQLAEGALPGTCHGATPETTAGECNLYLYHEGQVSFIARLDGSGGGDFGDWKGNASGPGGGYIPRLARVSDDGRTLLFSAGEKLTAYDNEGTQELYLYRDGAPNPIICVSCNPTGLPAGQGPSLGSSDPAVSTAPPAPVFTRNLSADGKRVFFESPEALVPADTNGEDGCPAPVGHAVCQDVYEWEADGTGSCHSETQNGGCLYLISSGKSSAPSYLIDASRSGDDVFFFTRSRLASQDEDDFVDVYDARVGGGLAAQNEAPPGVPCEGEACKGGATSPPETVSPTSALFSGPGNPKPHHKKAGPRKRRHRHKHRGHRQRRHAKAKGRAHR